MTHTQSKMADIEVSLMATWIARMVIRTTEVRTSVQKVFHLSIHRGKGNLSEIRQRLVK